MAIYCVCCCEAINPGDTYELVTLSSDTEYEMCAECAAEAISTSNRLGTYAHRLRAVAPVQSEALFGGAR